MSSPMRQGHSFWADHKADLKVWRRDFPGVPVIKNPYSQRRGIGVQSLGEELRSLMPRPSQVALVIKHQSRRCKR